jgi:hypothetical protein
MTMASGMYGLTLEKFFNLALTAYTNGLESETENKLMLVQDAYTPAFDTHNFRDDVTNEPTGSGTYATGGSVLTTTELTVASPAATQMKWDTDDLSWTGTTITARGGVSYHDAGTAATDEVVCANAFAGDVTTSGGTFTYQVHANGHFFIDYA